MSKPLAPHRKQAKPLTSSLSTPLSLHRPLKNEIEPHISTHGIFPVAHLSLTWRSPSEKETFPGSPPLQTSSSFSTTSTFSAGRGGRKSFETINPYPVRFLVLLLLDDDEKNEEIRITVARRQRGGKFRSISHPSPPPPSSRVPACISMGEKEVWEREKGWGEKLAVGGFGEELLMVSPEVSTFSLRVCLMIVADSIWVSMLPIVRAGGSRVEVVVINRMRGFWIELCNRNFFNGENGSCWI